MPEDPGAEPVASAIDAANGCFDAACPPDNFSTSEARGFAVSTDGGSGKGMHGLPWRGRSLSPVEEQRLKPGQRRSQ